MAKIISVNYFNTLIIKGDKPESLGGQWHIEESRIKGGFNDDFIDLGVKAYLVNEDFTEETLEEDLVASGLYNESTGVNNTNQFSLANPISKSMANNKGSIQKIFEEDTNLLVFQEEKVSFILINKNAIFTAQGGNLTTSGSGFFNQVNSYAGDYGISKNPESFAYYAGRKYFTDRSKGIVARLSRDGISEISNYGMRSFFRDNLSKSERVFGAWDIHDKKYILTLKGENLVTNGSFYDGSTNWILTNDVTISGNAAVFENTDDDAITSIKQANILEPGKTYRLQYEIKSNVQGGLRTSFMGADDPNGVILDTSVGKHVIELEAFNAAFILKRTADPTTLTITNIVISEIDKSFNNHKRSFTNNFDPVILGKNDFSVAFDEANNGWTSFFSFCPSSQGGSIDSHFYTFNQTDANTSIIWKHYDHDAHNSFYGVSYDSSIDLIFNNNPSLSKNFLTLNYEGGSQWSIDRIASGADNGADIALYNSANQDLIISGFQKIHNKYFANIINVSTALGNEVIFGESISGIKGFFLKLRIKTSATFLQEVFAVSTNYNINSY